MKKDIPSKITVSWLRKNPTYVFVFGDNLERRGKGGAAICRDEPNTYGSITKIAPNNEDKSFFRPEEYVHLCSSEMGLLMHHIIDHPNQIFLISKLGAGLANRYHIYEKVIKPILNKIGNNREIKDRIIFL